MNDYHPPDPGPIQTVRVSRHPVDWENAEFDEVTAQRVVSLGQKLQRGAWYLNPRFTVSSPSPTAEFFRKVLELRSAWLRTCRQSLGNSGQRRLARQAARQGRLASLLDFNPDTSAKALTTRPSLTVSLSGLPDDQRREVIQSGHLARQLGSSGILFIDGSLISPNAWQAMADKLLNRGTPPVIATIRRRVDLSSLESTGDPEPLEHLSREAIRAHLDAYPTHAAYVCPRVTVSAPAATPAFFREVDRQKTAWCTLLNRALGCGNVRRAIRASPPAAVALVYRGTLVVDGQLYLPGCWPTHPLRPGRLNKTPFLAPTVPPTYLGLKSPTA